MKDNTPEQVVNMTPEQRRHLQHIKEMFDGRRKVFVQLPTQAGKTEMMRKLKQLPEEK